jgi:hypothetical protein
VKSYAQLMIMGFGGQLSYIPFQCLPFEVIALAHHKLTTNFLTRVKNH